MKTSLKTQVSFFIGKATVAPMKALPISKLKLQAAVLNIRLEEDMLKALIIPVSNMFMWTESTTVLQWLNSDGKQPTSLANRIGKILELMPVEHWFQVLSGDNTAYTEIRRISADSIKMSRWVNRSSLLRNGEWF